ncbi:MAG: hypothetical protein CVV10_06910 [Gammaproteobacteria bacterium HGW-Gammaproteobacteria-14]|nr:MAG: hypothetical protein CVV10_06910 [Gammaproteobacteria bacterium HGW-Gammaproteobacteria-14]
MQNLKAKTIGRDLVELAVLFVALVALMVLLQGEPNFLRIPLMLGLALAIPSVASAAVKLGRDLKGDDHNDYQHHA